MGVVWASHAKRQDKQDRRQIEAKRQKIKRRGGRRLMETNPEQVLATRKSKRQRASDEERRGGSGIKQKTCVESVGTFSQLHST